MSSTWRCCNVPPDDATAWIDANQRHLVAALAEVRAALERHAARRDNGSPPKAMTPSPSALTPRPALDTLCSTFGLSSFERAVLLLCAGVELDAAFAGLCAAAQGDPARTYPTFSLALAALPEPHWSAVTPGGSLRHWRLIDVASPLAASLTASPLRIDERILHFLTGVSHLDERLTGLIEPVQPPGDLVPSHRDLARRMATAWSRAQGPLPLLELWGPDLAGKRDLAAAACAGIGLKLNALAAGNVPASAAELEGVVRLWEREAALTLSGLYVEADTLDPADARAVAAVARFVERVGGAVLLGTRDRWRPLRRTALTFEVRKPTAAEQRGVWHAVLGDAAARLNGQIERLAAQLNLTGSAIRAAAQEGLASEKDGTPLDAGLWEAGRARARPRLDDLAQRIESRAVWEDLVLPEAELQQLREIAAHVARRATVYEVWGFGAAGNRGLAFSALFAGASGTGKTLAAEVLANALGLDLYRIDLSSVVSKYIGETEKNLRRVFDAAEDGGAVLFFDEADALFGKRSEVKDSHDRYANIEISYLLQRMEAYRGLAILATNRKGDLDPAFLRRLRFVVNFPFPDATLRVAIWRRAFPPGAPTEGLDPDRLARLNVTGGNIHNIALYAAFLAADAGEPVRMSHLLRAARAEYAKLERSPSEADVAGGA
jgi:hypothetical protein